MVLGYAPSHPLPPGSRLTSSQYPNAVGDSGREEPGSWNQLGNIYQEEMLITSFHFIGQSRSLADLALRSGGAYWVAVDYGYPESSHQW